jgi:hypothetical protein
VDVAVFTGARAEYLVSAGPGGTVLVDHQGGVDGVDTLRNVERLTFADGTWSGDGATLLSANVPASGTVAISDATPAEDQPLTATPALVDPNGVDAASLLLVWEAEFGPDVWAGVGTGPTFTPTDAVVGRRLRVVATFEDLATVPAIEVVTSAATAAVAAVNDPATGAPALSTASPQAGVAVSALTAGIADVDGVGPLAFQWRADGAAIPGATGASFVPSAAHVGRQLSVVVSFTDRQGFAEALASASSAPVAAAPAAPPVVAPPVDPPAGAPGAGPDPGAGPGAPPTGAPAAPASGSGGCSSAGAGGWASLAGLLAAALALRGARRRRPGPAA